MAPVSLISPISPRCAARSRTHAVPTQCRGSSLGCPGFPQLQAALQGFATQPRLSEFLSAHHNLCC